jgi:F-type H+-transporting ATPase subunit epsilon
MVRRSPKDSDHTREIFATSGGAIEVADNILRVLVDEADKSDDINEAEAQKALQRAHKMVSEAKDQVSLEHAQSLIDRYEVRLQVAGLRRHPRK